MERLKAFLRKIYREQSGITGLETAIILIAFVVIAAVFAYTVLSAGMFSSQSSQEAIYSGIEETRATMELKGNTIFKANSTSCTEMIFNVANALAGEGIDFTPPTDTGDDGIADSGSNNVVVASYNSQGGTYTDDLDWSMTSMGNDDGDNILEVGEEFQITVDLKGVGESIGTYKSFTIEMKPPRGAVLKIERTTPGVLDTVMILH